MNKITMIKEVVFEDATLAIEHITYNPKAPTLVFLHDSLGCITLWRNFPEQLAKRTECNYLIYDREGYGRSSACDFLDRKKGYLEAEADKLGRLLEQLDIKNPILFGHSDGASIALLTAAQYPEKIKAVISEAAHVFVEQITLDGVESAHKQFQTTNLSKRLEKYHGDKAEAVFNAWTSIWLSDAFLDWNMEEALSKILCPTLVIQGTADAYGSVRQVEAIADLVKGSVEVFMPKGLGHSPHKEAPDAILETTKRFLRQL
jgi:pimeloyl-ACP methyl ester carboxylesterase